MTHLLIYIFIMVSILWILLTIYKNYMRWKYLRYIVKIIKINAKWKYKNIWNIKIPYNDLKEIVNAKKENIIPKLKASIIRNNKKLKEEYWAINIKDIQIGKDNYNNIYYNVKNTYKWRII